MTLYSQPEARGYERRDCEDGGLQARGIQRSGQQQRSIAWYITQTSPASKRLTRTHLLASGLIRTGQPAQRNCAQLRRASGLAQWRHGAGHQLYPDQPFLRFVLSAHHQLWHVRHTCP